MADDSIPEVQMHAMCDGCAFREGTLAHARSGVKAELCVTLGIPFLCHANMEGIADASGKIQYRTRDGEPEALCCGFVVAFQESIKNQPPEWRVRVARALMDTLEKAEDDPTWGETPEAIDDLYAGVLEAVRPKP